MFLRPAYFKTVECTNIICKRFAGHSKWSNIKHDKGLKDAQRGNLFTKLSRQIKVAIQEGGSIDPKCNLKLEQVIEQTKRVNMPAATVQSVIKSTLVDKNQSKSYTLEIKGPGSCIILMEVFTENLHHFKQTLATILKKNGSKFSDGGGKHMFECKGIIDTEPLVDAKSMDVCLETATEHAIDCGAEDVKIMEDNNLQFICDPNMLSAVLRKLEKLNYRITNGSVEYVPLKTQILGEMELEQCGTLYEKLDNVPEIVKLYDNID